MYTILFYLVCLLYLECNDEQEVADEHPDGEDQQLQLLRPGGVRQRDGEGEDEDEGLNDEEDLVGGGQGGGVLLPELPKLTNLQLPNIL